MLVDVINHLNLVKARKGERKKKKKEKAANSQTASPDRSPGSCPVGKWNAFKVRDTISMCISHSINQIWANTERSIRALCS